jgi:hypothetical protein
MADARPPIQEDERFLLGKIASIVEALPTRMDRFEVQVTASLAEIGRRMSVVETTQAADGATRKTAQTVRTSAFTLLGSLASGMLVWFLGKH